MSGDFYEVRNHRIPVSTLTSDVEQGGPLKLRVDRLVSLLVNAEERLSLTRRVTAIDLAEAQPTHPLHVLAVHAERVEQLSELSEDAFKEKLTLDISSGTSFVLRLGVPAEDPAFSRHGVPAAKYVNSLRELPTLESQGLGIRSYMGMMMELLAGSSHLFVLVDEPEAFLHPPQAERIGRKISDLKSDSSQVIVATHDSSVLKGLLSSERADQVIVVRIRRDGDLNPVAVLDAADLEALWSDPALRYSSVLDGVFSEGVVVCEGDPDCRLYESAMDAIDAEGAEGIHFTHGGGTGRIPVIADAPPEFPFPRPSSWMSMSSAIGLS